MKPFLKQALSATGIEIGLLLNFGAERLQFKRKTRTYRPRKAGQDFQDLQDEKAGRDVQG